MSWYCIPPQSHSLSGLLVRASRVLTNCGNHDNNTIVVLLGNINDLRMFAHAYKTPIHIYLPGSKPNHPRVPESDPQFGATLLQ